MSKFSEELIGAQLALVFFASALAVYWMLIRKKKRETAEWVPAALVRGYLDRVRKDEREIRLKLFGEDSGQVVASSAPLSAALSTATDPALLRELEALRAQLSSADQRSMEHDRLMNTLRAEKTVLEQKLKDAQATAASAGTGAPAAAAAGPETAAMQKEVEDLRARLQEYEVIEDELANLKKFQKENEQLRQKVEQLEKGGATTVSGAPAAAEAKTVVSGAAEKAQPSMTVVSGGAAPAASAEAKPAPALSITPPPAEAPPAAAAAAAPAAEANTNVLQPITPTADPAAPAATAAPAVADAPAAAGAPAAPEKNSKQKEEELLSEFEKMLAS